MSLPRPRSTILTAVASISLLLPVLAACSSDTSSSDAGSSAGSTESAELVVYSGRSEELVGPLFKEFTTETGVTVNARFGDSAELAAQMLEEGDRSPAQIYFSQDAGALGAVEELLATLPESVTSLVPQQYRATNNTWTGVTGRARVIAYDPQSVPAEQVPQSVFELTDEKWRGQVAIAPTNASFQAFVTAMRVTQGDDVTRDWLTGLVNNDVQTYEKNGLILDAVDSGQVQLGLINHYYWYEKAAEVGEDNMRAEVAFMAPKDPGSLVNVAGVGILKGAAENSAAIEFVQWLLSPNTQEWFVNNTYEYPLVEDVASAEGLPELDSLAGPDIALAQLADLPGTLNMLQDVGLL
ncbi:MAG: iron ABC transporter substrate-binding protein [Actinomycetia bacterium]|jgi:iron(III) transport system substrate-binding protein|nr:iron ABC transporter substrate-binding protein [Actinomycetes bacterium]